ncbi:MAG TPA: hypothetical protein VK420_06310 [Longimicrobium sp.]|nr:hypothetical protein [Longimicrobium sp.]
MNVLLVPPHGDFTLEWPAPEGFWVVDAARAFIRRALSPEALRAEITAREPSTRDAEGARALLLLKAASALLGTALLGTGDSHRHLRAVGAALTGLSSAACPVRLRLDDLELPGATTEKSADVLAAAARPGAPYDSSLAWAVEQCARAEVVRIRLDGDQQLPSVMALLERLRGGRHRLELTGAFAATHWGALARLSLLEGVTWVDSGGTGPRMAGSPLLSSAGTDLRWVDDPYHFGPPRAFWGGAVPFGALADARALIATGPQVLVLGFCALGDEAVGADGTVLSARDFRAALDALRTAGVRLVGEWWIGAPGIGADALERTLRELEHAPFDWLAGVRAFHWLAGRGDGTWGRVEVSAGSVGEGRDLARSRPFSAPGSLGAEEAAARLRDLAQALAKRAPLAPGRMAEAFVELPSPPPERGDRVRLDPDCALVTLPLGLDGRVGSATYAANLRTGGVMAVDGRLAPSLAKLEAPASVADALPQVPEGQRPKLVKALVEKAVLVEVRG